MLLEGWEGRDAGLGVECDGMDMYYTVLIGSTFIEQSVTCHSRPNGRISKAGYERWGVMRISSRDLGRAFDRYENGSRVHTLPPTPIARYHKLHSPSRHASTLPLVQHAPLPTPLHANPGKPTQAQVSPPSQPTASHSSVSSYYPDN